MSKKGPEKTLQDDVMLACGNGDTRLFRNNVGTGWAGRIERLRNGALLITDPRPLHAGLCKGSCDLIGFRTIEITPDMVGQRLAVFVGLETKSKRGCMSAEQEKFVDTVQYAGGFAGEVRSIEQALHILRRG